MPGEPAVTIDGASIEVAANVGGPGEVPAAVAAGADGIGLVPHRVPVHAIATTLPDEHEQEAAYRAAAEALARDGRCSCGPSTRAPTSPSPPSARPARRIPFLGVRGIRLGLARPDLLLAQLRALLRVAADHPVRVMFPMIATTEELHGRDERLLERARDRDRR